MASQSIIIIIISLSLIIISSSMAETQSSVPAAAAAVPVKETAAVHIVYTDRPVDEDLEIFHMRTLSSVLGSEEAAQGALLYTYKHAACGFSAKLTPKQVEELSKRPGVLQVIESRTMQLHDAPANV
uniref:subtilisin-like protease SBT3.17 n=1 Tax=Erigeron canadensis TaxID=72917 RepID=UPI001CB93B46|nr:subtilisin-like protease SBT3.17 [Erigeron canadensis]